MNDADTSGSVDWQLTDIIESIPAGFLWCDANDRVVVSNNLFRKWFFPDNQDVVVPGVPFIDLLKTCGDPRWIEKRMQLRLDPGEPFQHRMRDGRVLRTFEKAHQRRRYHQHPHGRHRVTHAKGRGREQR